MLFPRKMYTIKPDMYDIFNYFFHTYLLPNQLTHCASLVGRWVNESKTEIIAMWAYRDRADFECVDQLLERVEV